VRRGGGNDPFSMRRATVNDRDFRQLENGLGVLLMMAAEGSDRIAANLARQELPA
jgi:hypothetical protein